MASLLSKFRIDYSALKMISDITRRPKDSTLAYFDKLIAPFKCADDDNSMYSFVTYILCMLLNSSHLFFRKNFAWITVKSLYMLRMIT